MKLKVTKQYDNCTVVHEIESADDMKALEEAAVWGTPTKCTLCDCATINLISNRAQTDDGEYIYIKRQCRKCGATSTLGKYKSGGYFWKKFERYEQKSNTPVVQKKSTGKSKELPSDLPWDE